MQRERSEVIAKYIHQDLVSVLTDIYRRRATMLENPIKPKDLEDRRRL